MSSLPRVLGGLLVAPPAAGAIIGLGLGLIGLTPAILFAPVIGALFGWPAAIVLGLPAYLLLRRWRLTSWYAYTLAGLLMGLAAAGIAAAFTMLLCDGPDAASCGLPLSLFARAGGILLGAMFGAVGGAVFWGIVAREPRPDGVDPDRWPR